MDEMTGLKSNSNKLLDSLRLTSENVTDYTKQTEELIGPTSKEKEDIRKGYESITTDKQALKEKTELQELIDLAVKGVVKAYAGYRGLKSGQDLSATEITTPDRSAAYARGLETLRSKEDEVRGQERSLDKALASKERRYGELLNAQERALALEERKKREGKEDTRYAAHLARQAKADKERDENEEASVWNARLTEVALEEKRTFDLVSLAEIGAIEIKQKGNEAGSKSLAAVSQILKGVGYPPEKIQELIDKGDRPDEQKKINKAIRRYRDSDLAIKQEFKKLYSELKDAKTTPTENQRNKLNALKLASQVTLVKAAATAARPVGFVSYVEHRHINPDNPSDKEEFKKLLEETQLKKDKLSAWDDDTEITQTIQKITTVLNIWDKMGNSPEMRRQLETESKHDDLKIPEIKEATDISSAEDFERLKLEAGERGNSIGIRIFGIGGN